MQQKVVNYRMHVAIVGDFQVTPGRDLRDFIYESNKSNKVVFVSTVNDALQKFTNDKSSLVL